MYSTSSDDKDQPYFRKEPRKFCRWWRENIN
nr:MAG TPA: hypothetical protein [Caudoviricetes sp.]